MSLLHIENLSIEFPDLYGDVRVVDNFSLHMKDGEVHGLVGESGSGKSLAVLGLLGLLDDQQTRIRCDHFTLANNDLLRCSNTEKRNWLARDASIILQDVQGSLNPSFTVGWQLDEVIRLHHGGSSRQRKDRARELLTQVGVNNSSAILTRYPHQLTIGVNQRVMIALALACEPRLLIADEPTTGLDVTIQAQTLDLLFRLNADRGMGLLLITHDFALLSRQVDHITVMYCGQVVESGTAERVLQTPAHPYSRALLDSIPHFEKECATLAALRGHTPSMHHLPVGCYFGPRCTRAFRDCAHTVALSHIDNHRYRCLAPLNVEQES